MEVVKRTRAALICATEYHIFNCLNIASNIISRKDNDVDLFISKSVTNRDQGLISKVKSTDLFRNVLVYDDDVYDKRFIKKVERLLFPKHECNKMIEGELDHIIYDSIYLGTLNIFAKTLIIFQKECKVYYYDEGLASYLDNVNIQFITKKERIAYNILGYDFKKIYPKRLYLRNPSMSISTNTPISAIPLSDNRVLLNKIYGVSPQAYNEKKIVFLSQPLFSARKAEEENIIVQTLKKLEKYKIVFRPHPRANSRRELNCCIDSSNCLWEYICFESITNDHILFSVCSTALFTPKLICNKEPYVLFLYPLFNDLFTDRQNFFFNTHFLQIKKLYKNPQKIFRIESLDEINPVIDSILNQHWNSFDFA